MQLSGVRPSVCLSVSAGAHSSKPAAAEQMSIDCCTAGGPTISSSRAAAADERGQCHVVSVRIKLNNLIRRKHHV